MNDKKKELIEGTLFGSGLVAIVATLFTLGETENVNFLDISHLIGFGVMGLSAFLFIILLAYYLIANLKASDEEEMKKLVKKSKGLGDYSDEELVALYWKMRQEVDRRAESRTKQAELLKEPREVFLAERELDDPLFNLKRQLDEQPLEQNNRG